MRNSAIVAIAIVTFLTGAIGYGIFNRAVVNNSSSCNCQKSQSTAREGCQANASYCNDENNKGNHGRGSRGCDQGRESNHQSSAAERGSLETIKGAVASTDLADGNSFILSVDSKQYVVEIGPKWYWENEGISIKKGDNLRVTGFIVVEHGENTIAAQKITNLDTGQSVTLRDNNGQPLWRGHGKYKAS